MQDAGFDVLEGISFNEFVVKFNKPISEINAELLEEGIIGGFDLGFIDEAFNNHMLIAVTELRTKRRNRHIYQKVGEYSA